MKRQAVATLAILFVLALISGTNTAWASSLAAPLRQTVPLTPPATWTPQAPPRVTAVPTLVPIPTPQEVGAVAQLWVSVQVNAIEIAPGDVVTLDIGVTNIGGQDSGVVTIQVDAGDMDILGAANSFALDVQEGWQAGLLKPGGTDSCQVSLQASENLWPGTSHLISVSATDGATSCYQSIELFAPRALLPATGL